MLTPYSALSTIALTGRRVQTRENRSTALNIRIDFDQWAFRPIDLDYSSHGLSPSGFIIPRSRAKRQSVRGTPSYIEQRDDRERIFVA